VKNKTQIRYCFKSTMKRLTTILWTRKCTCKLKAVYTATLPPNIVPTATNLPSSDTANADKLSLHGTAFFKDPSSGSHSWRNAFCLPSLPTGFTSTNNLLLFTSPSTNPNLVMANQKATKAGHLKAQRIIIIIYCNWVFSQWW